jgi:signal transduction histidine kinase
VSLTNLWRTNLWRTSAFRLTILYVALFSLSVLTLFAFIYWSTVRVIERQTVDTVEAEIRGLAEQYRHQSLSGLIRIIDERSGVAQNDVYLLTDEKLQRLAGNLSTWPPQAPDGGWVRLTLSKRQNGTVTPYEVRARTFLLPGDHRLLVGRDTEEKTRFQRMIVETLGWSLAAALVLGLIGGIVLSRRVLARVDQMTRTARRIMAGEWSQRIAKDGSGDEFDRLAASLNMLLGRIERLMTGMRLATDSLAHDLRGPLTRLRGRIELALRQPAGSGGDRDALADVLAQSDAAIATFDSLLKIAQAEAGMAEDTFQDVDLGAIARDAADLYEPLAEEHGVTMAVAVDEGAMVSGQPQLLAQAVGNLVDNAVKYTPEGGRITVSVRPRDGRIELCVADSGPGIPAADRERVLERFVRLEECRSTPGAGLGLSLVAAVARLHGAELTLSDNDPGLRVCLLVPASGHKE